MELIFNQIDSCQSALLLNKGVRLPTKQNHKPYLPISACAVTYSSASLDAPSHSQITQILSALWSRPNDLWPYPLLSGDGSQKKKKKNDPDKFAI